MRIIAVDDDKNSLEVLFNAIKEIVSDNEIERFCHPNDALEYVGTSFCNIAFLAIKMSEMSGIELAEKLKKHNPHINIIFCTGYEDHRAKAFEMHVSGYLMKPITPEKIKQELENLRYPIFERKRLKVQAFGNFEVYIDGEPITFKYKRTKELFAYLIDRAGALCTIGEIMGILFEDKSGKEDYFQKLRRDLISTLESFGCEKAIIHKRGMLGVAVSEIQCDYYDCLNGITTFSRCYFGEYMSQYSFAEYTNALLNAKIKNI